MNLETNEMINITLVISAVLFFTGLSVVPFVNKITSDAWQQNIMYAIGRVPVVFATLYVYLSMGEK